MIHYRKFIFLWLALTVLNLGSIGQLCTQPGSLLSVRNSYRSHTEYIIFTFVDPFQTKGDLNKTEKALLNVPPSVNSSDIKGEQFYTISFNKTFPVCDTKNYCVVPQSKVKDVRQIQRNEGKIVYVIGLSKNAKITSHTMYDYHGFHMVKIRVE